MINKIKITFNVIRRAEQEIELANGFSAATVIDFLAQGDALTTIQEGGDVTVVNANRNFSTIGTIINTELQDAEYFDFELLDTWEEKPENNFQDFLDSADSYQTSIEIMEAIVKIASNPVEALDIWAEPNDVELLRVWEIVTKNGNIHSGSFFWGRAGVGWAQDLTPKSP